MDAIVNNLASIERQIHGSGIRLTYDTRNDSIGIASGSQALANLQLIRLHRPSSNDVIESAAPDRLLVISGASQRAARAVLPYNHIILPSGSYRIIAPGIAVHHEPASLSPPPESRQVRLMGRSGVVAETLLLGGARPWSVHEAAAIATVSPALAQRVIHRLERDNLLKASGIGRKKVRTVTNPRALAELWSQEEKQPSVVARGYLYGSSNEAVVRRILEICPDSAAGGVLAANTYTPTLTRVPLPVRLWIPEWLDRSMLETAGFEETQDGANIELMTIPYDPWRIHADVDGIRKVSAWRAWMEVSHATGRVQELAETLLKHLEDNWYGSR